MNTSKKSKKSRTNKRLNTQTWMKKHRASSTVSKGRIRKKKTATRIWANAKRSQRRNSIKRSDSLAIRFIFTGSRKERPVDTIRK